MSLPSLMPARWRRSRPASQALALALALAGGGLLVVAAHAASVQEQADPLQRQDAAAQTTIGQTLDRALSVDTQAGQRNLDLLLETRTVGDAQTEAAARRASAMPPQARTPAVPPAAGPANAAAATPTPGMGLSAAPPGMASLPDDSAGPPGALAQREWLGVAPRATIDNPGLLTTPMGTAGGMDLELPRSGQDGARGLDPGLRGAVVRDTVAFLREYRYWLLGALAGVAAAVAGVQAWLRRTGETPERRAERLTEQRSTRRTRRRSTRRA